MTISEKRKVESDFYQLAKGWKTDFVMNQFQMLWQLQREMESDLVKSGFDVACINRRCEYFRIRRNALVRVLKERGEC